MPMSRTTRPRDTRTVFGILPSILHDPRTVYAPTEYIRRLPGLA